MRVLVACEFSGKVRDAFRRLGHEAWSCDLLPPLADSTWPNYHLQGDVLDYLDGYRGPGGQPWDMMIAHPPCTYLTNSAEWAYKDPDFARYPGVGYHQRLKPGTLFGQKRREARAAAIAFVEELWNAPIPRIAIENPVGCLGSRLGRAQTIQPHQFGADASKGTCLWLKGLPRLVPTKHIAPRIVKGRPRWANQTDSGQNKLSPAEDRWATRSLTYPGIAAAMANQWSAESFSLV